MKLKLFWLMAIAIPAMAQVSNPSIISVTVAPSGACSSGLPNQQVVSTGVQYSCQGGTWASIGGGSGSGTVNAGTTGQIAYYPGNAAAVSGTSFISDTTSAFFLGTGAGNATTTGTGNTAVGYQAGHALTVPASGANPQQNTIMGYQAGIALTSAREMTCIGYWACNAFIGNGQGVEDGLSMGIGSLALQSFTGTGAGNTDVVAIGQKAAENLTGGGFDVFIGNHSGQSLSTASSSLLIGGFITNPAVTGLTSTSDTLIGEGVESSITGNSQYNVMIGSGAGDNQLAPSYNVFIGLNSAGQGTASASTTGASCIGFQSCGHIRAANYIVADGYNALNALTTGNANVAFGYNALQSIDIAYNNTAVGSYALYQLGSGGNNGNTAVGYQAGSNLTGGSNNVYVGNGVSAATASDNYEIVIGSGSTGKGSYTTEIGTTNTTATYLGGIEMPLVTYSHAGTQLAACAIGTLGGKAFVSDATALVPGTAYSVSAGAGSDAVWVQCTLVSSTYAWQTM